MHSAQVEQLCSVRTYSEWGDVVGQSITRSRTLLFFVSSMHCGGAERVASQLATSWADSGNSVTLVVTYSGRGDCFYRLSSGVRLIYLADIVPKVRLRSLSKGMRLLAIRRCLKETQPDVVVSFLTNVNVAVLAANIGLGYKVVVSERTYPPMLDVGRTLSELRRRLYSRAFRVVMLTSEGASWLRDKISGARGVVIPNYVLMPLTHGEPFVSWEEFAPVGTYLMLGVGRLDEGKQFGKMIEAFAAVADRDSKWRLAIIGEGPEHGMLQEQVKRLGLAQRVFLAGRVGNISDWYRRAEIFVSSSRFEGFPNTLLEAMAHGCVAISYDCNAGPRDLIRDGIDGMLVTPVGDIAALSRAMDHLMMDEKLRREMSVRAVDVTSRFSPNRILKLWDDLFESAMSSAKCDK